MRSKGLFALIALVMVLCLSLFSCGEDDTEAPSSGYKGPGVANDSTFGVDFGDLLG